MSAREGFAEIILSRQQKHLQGKVFPIFQEKGETYQVLSYRMPVWWRKKEVEEEAMRRSYNTLYVLLRAPLYPTLSFQQRRAHS